MLALRLVMFPARSGTSRSRSPMGGRRGATRVSERGADGKKDEEWSAEIGAGGVRCRKFVCVDAPAAEDSCNTKERRRC